MIESTDCPCINPLDPPEPCIVCDERACDLEDCPVCGYAMHAECEPDHECMPSLERITHHIDGFFDSTEGEMLVGLAVAACGLITYGVLLRWFVS